MKKGLIDFIIYLVVGIMIWVIAFFAINPHSAETTADVMRYYSDTFTIPAICLICVYILSVVAKKGFFDGMFYSVRYIGQSLLPFLVKPLEKDGYYEYKVMKEEKRKEPNIAGLIVGLIFLVGTIIFYILYKVV